MIRDAVLAAIKVGVPAFQGRVFEPHAIPWDMPNAEDFPYAVVIFGPEAKTGTWEDRTTSFDVLVYTDQTTYQIVDTLIDDLVAVLDNKRLIGTSGEQVITDYIGAPVGDQVDSRWRAVYRPARFAVYPMSWLSSTFGTLVPDPVVGLATWTHHVFPSVGVDPTTWTPDDATPAVYWRVDRIEGVEPHQFGNWWTLLIRGHVLIPDTRLRNDWIMRLLGKLGFQHHVVLSDGSWMTFQPGGITADVEADPFRQGQITLRAKMFKSETCDPESPAGILEHGYATHAGVTSDLDKP